MKNIKRIKYLVAAIVVAGFLLILFQPFEFEDVSVLVSMQSKPETLINKFGIPDKAQEVSAITVDGPDGPMPEIAIRSFKINDNADTLKKFYQKKCMEAGLLKPEKDLLHLEPTAICEGRNADGKFTVLLSVKCSDSLCFATIEARHLM